MLRLLSHIRFHVLLIAALLVGSALHAQSLRELVGRKALTSQRTIISGGQLIKPDSATVAHRDSIMVAHLKDSLRLLPTDSLKSVTDSVRMLLPDSVRHSIFDTVDSLRRDSLLKAEKLYRQKYRRNGEEKKPFFSDSMSFRRVCWTSLVLPGFGQIYNKQYWKLPILYGLVGTSLGMFFYENNKYKPLKSRFNELTDLSMSRTDELNSIQRQMIKYNTARQAFLITAIASYVYFLGDAAICYSTSDVASVQKATTLAMICPGAGQIYNKSYWRFPIVLGGFASMIYCIDWNNRGYDRFKKAYRLKNAYETHPEFYPNGSLDEFKGRYSASFLKDLRNSYRRNRDLCIIITAGLYLLQVIDAHVDAHLRDYDVSDNLKVSVSPMFNYEYNPGIGMNTGRFGMNLSLTF